jgi:hypothetical protein
MNRRSLGFIAIVLVILMAIVATAGLDNLPRDLRSAAAAESSKFSTDRATFDRNRQAIEQALNEDPALFGAKAGEFRERLDRDHAGLNSAAKELVTLQQLAKANRRTDTDKVRQEISRLDSMRADPVRDTAALLAEVQQWQTWKRELPQRVQAMRASYEAVKAFDLDSATAAARKAMTDWPAKKDDLTGRLDALKSQQAEAEKIWSSTAAMRAAAEARKTEGFDYPTFFGSADRLDAIGKDLKQGAASLNDLAGQLYTSWDKVLVDAGKDRGSYREKFRIVRTKFPDATLANGQTSSEEKWQSVDHAQYREAERIVGMTVERKPAGKYDSEAERAVQPPEYAYVAPPGQRNSYGYWDSGIWHWLPQYLILSQMLHMSRPVVITSGDFDAYQAARRRGEVFYGRNDEYRPHWGGTAGGGWSWGRSNSPPNPTSSTGWYKERPKTWGSSGYSGSKYESRGGYSGSKYQSHSGGYKSFSRGGGGMRSFGRGGRR